MRRSSSYFGVLLAAAFGLFAGDVTETQRRSLEAQEAQRQRALERDATARYVPGAVVADACENGDFEKKGEIDPGFAGWSGAYGTVKYRADEPDLGSLNSGIMSGRLDRLTSRQTIVRVEDGLDLNVGISQVAPGRSTRAVRIGNAVSGGGVELLERTFVVSADRPTIGFRYAVVLELPEDHKPEHRPQFRVRVTDAHGIEIPDVVHLNTGVEGITDRLTAASGPPGHPFTTLVRSFRVPIVYRPWTCAFIDLTGHVGETVTVQFIVEDCSEFAHWGYAYVDDFCEDCASEFSFDEEGSTRCGPGQLCFRYVLPRDGSVVIQVDLLRNGQVITPPMISGVLDRETKYCFPIVPSFDFDFIATATFSSGTVISIGTVPDGMWPGSNNDYLAACPSCGTGTNLVRNGDFEGGNSEFDAALFYEPVVAPSSVQPGEYSIVDGVQARTICSCWPVNNHEPCNATGRFLVVNGATGKTGSRRIWSQMISVVPGTAYRFCAHFRNLRQCALDVRPKIELRFTSPPDVVIPSGTKTINADPANLCDWQQESRRIVIPPGVVLLTAEIWLDESGEGDGNDLAVDGLSLRVEAADVLP